MILTIMYWCIEAFAFVCVLMCAYLIIDALRHWEDEC